MLIDRFRWTTLRDTHLMNRVRGKRGYLTRVRDYLTWVSIPHAIHVDKRVIIGIAPWGHRHPSPRVAVRVGCFRVLQLMSPGFSADRMFLQNSPIRLIGLQVVLNDNSGAVYQLRGLLNQLQTHTGGALHLHVAAHHRQLLRAYEALGFEVVIVSDDEIEMKRRPS